MEAPVEENLTNYQRRRERCSMDCSDVQSFEAPHKTLILVTPRFAEVPKMTFFSELKCMFLSVPKHDLFLWKLKVNTYSNHFFI